jgi:thiamine-phosphate pyrophosphorylase
MTDTQRLVLLTPILEDPDDFLPRLAAAFAGGEAAAVIGRFAAADERTLTKRIRALAGPVQEAGAALVVAVAGEAQADIVLAATRAGADGVHLPVDASALADARERLRDGRMLGCGALKSRDEAMSAGESGVDYLMFGEPRADGSLPTTDFVVERASWWAEIFETPCIAFASSLDAVDAVAATRAEFVAVGDAVWDHPEGPGDAVARIAARLKETVF